MTLYNEIKNYMKPYFVHKAYKADAEVNSPGTSTMMITVKDKYSLVSLITMIAPSPDWFVGLDSYDLCGSSGWKDDVMMDLLPWDAGTDSGTNFNSANSMTMPYDVIMRITPSSNTQMMADAAKPFAKVLFKKYTQTTSSPATTQPSKAPALNHSAGVLTLLFIAFLVTMRLLN